ncbi:MAG: MotA/TolQ/ExbB proton channel family protein [Planctomycetaceae bacterium]
MLRVVAALFGRGDSSRHSEVRQAAETGRRGFVAAGWVGVIIGVIQTLSAMDDPSQLGRGMAVTLLTAFYGYLFAYLICLPVERSAVSD